MTAWDAYLDHDTDAIPEADRWRLDAAEALVHRTFGIDPDDYLRPNNAPGRHLKLSHVVAALVLRRDVWDSGLPVTEDYREAQP
jgi:hypothetical protein